MALVVFRSKAAGEIFMFAETAHRLFEIIGRKDSIRGVITPDDLPAAIAAIEAAIAAERERDEAAQAAAEEAIRSGEITPATRPVSLAQRAWPLLEMLRAANKKSVEVTWGV